MTNTNHSLLLSTLLATMTLPATPLFAAQTVTETRDLSGFNTVKFTSDGDVSIREGEDFAVVVTGPADLVEKAKTLVRDETLKIFTPGKNWLGGGETDDLHFAVTMPRIDGVHLTGAGDIDVGPLVTKNLSVTVTGSGDILMDDTTAKDVTLSVTGSGNIEIKQLEAITSSATISGSGDIEVSGEVSRQTITIMGSGDFSGKKLNAETASGAIMGSGDIDLGRVKERSFRQTGSGSVSVADGGDTLSYHDAGATGSPGQSQRSGHRGIM